MNISKERGFGHILVILIIAFGAAYFIKDDQGVRYTDKAIGAFKYYTVDRNKDALNKAEGVKSMLQERQDELQKMVGEN